MENNRRDFLRKSILGLSGAAMLPSTVFAGSNEKEAQVPPELPVRMLGKTGIKTPLLSMGTAGATSVGFIRAAYEQGIKLFFSATYYGEGNNEKLVGEALKGLPRDSFVAGTAVPPDGLDNRTGKFIKPFDPQAYIKKADESLKRFGFDHVDVFLFPYAGKKEMVLNEDVLKALEQIKKQGKTRFLGIASHSDTVEALDAASGSGIYDVAMIAYNFRTENKQQVNASIEKAVKAGMGIVAMKSTAGAADSKSGSPFNSDAALKWVLQNNNISSIVSGMSSLEEMQKNLAMIKDIRMTEQELKDLRLASENRELGLYCLQCKKCIPQCRQNLDVPSIMRSYMYAYGYRNIHQAWHTLASAKVTADACGNCEKCIVKCTAGFDVKRKISDIARLANVPGDLIGA